MGNKTGLLDDFFDFIFMVFSALFILFFLQIIISGGIEQNHRVTLNLVDRVDMVNDYLTEIRGSFEQGKNTSMEELSTTIKSIHEYGEREVEKAALWGMEK
ncbi:hypothetical protein HZC32_02845 [Candidatus Woesearchaeota archaeon]|nr:hypothetical protein [Candidatus Woesearchaeota archaeon]